ncbi:MAG: hypothetical protein R3A47_04680 [Polyangiales bacterium]
MIGSYCAPCGNVDHRTFLQTLDLRQRAPTGSPVIKHALAQDASIADAIFDVRASLEDFDFISECVKGICELRSLDATRSTEERDQGMVLHYGHTLGHAIEHGERYALGHGESIAIGIVMTRRTLPCTTPIYVAPEIVDTHRGNTDRYGV